MDKQENMIMKKIILSFLTHLVIITLTFSQSPGSILRKIGGQLLQDLSKKDEWKAIGKAIETAGEMTYEIEKINALNKKEITIKTNLDNTNRVYPVEGYKWKNPEIKNDYSVAKITNVNKKSYSTSLEWLEKSFNSFETGDYDIAIRYSSSSISIEETYLAYLLRGTCYILNNMDSEGLEDFGNVLNFNIDDEVFSLVCILRVQALLNCGKYTEVINLCNEYIDLGWEDFFSEIFLIKGNANYFLNNYDSAIEDFNRSIEVNPNNFDAIISRGSVKIIKNDIEGGLKDCNLAIDLILKRGNLSFIDKNSPATVYTNRAVCYASVDKYRDAINDCNEALGWDNEYSKAFLVRGVSKIKLGFKESGCIDLKRAKELGLSIDELDEYINNCK